MADRTLAQLAQAVEVLTARVVALEEAKNELERTAEIVQAAQRSWRALMRTQGGDPTQGSAACGSPTAPSTALCGAKILSPSECA